MNLNQITISSVNLAKSVAFYQKLGLELIVDSLPRYARFVCPNGNSTFSIHLVEELPSGNGIIVYFEEENLKEKITELKQNGIQFEQELINQPWLWKEAKLKDPDGNQIILYFAGENRLNPPWKIKKS